MVDFINEVEEELRKDKYNVLLRKFGPYIVAVIFAIVAGSGFYEYQKASKNTVSRRAAASYTAAASLVDTGDLQSAINNFVALGEAAPQGYAGLSFSRAAGLKVQLGDMDGAIALFDRSAQAFEKPVHSDLSSLKAAYILMDLGRYDDVKTRAAALAIDDAAFQDLAKELLAYASLKTGDVNAARTQFTYLANIPGVLQGVQTRAKQSVTLLNANQSVPDLDTPDVNTDLPAPDAVMPDVDTDMGTEIVPTETSKD